MYLIIENGNPMLVNDEVELERTLKLLCYKWTLDDYEGPSHEELYEQCKNNHDFCDIATIFELPEHYYDTEKVVLTRIG